MIEHILVSPDGHGHMVTAVTCDHHDERKQDAQEPLQQNKQPPQQDKEALQQDKEALYEIKEALIGGECHASIV